MQYRSLEAYGNESSYMIVSYEESYGLLENKYIFASKVCLEKYSSCMGNISKKSLCV
jgi:hypothetical protein